jgi:hypothetical protein
MQTQEKFTLILHCNQIFEFENNQLRFRGSGNYPSLRGIHGTYLKSMKRNQKITTINQLDLETVEFLPVMIRILPNNSPEVLIFKLNQFICDS